MPKRNGHTLRRIRYSTLYRVRNNELQIIGVTHHSRRPGYWKKVHRRGLKVQRERSFAEILSSRITSGKISPRPLEAGECQSPSGQRCSLCHAGNLDYAAELKLKNDALQTCWSALHLDVPLDDLVPSPLGRNYRTTTKRRAFQTRDSIRLGLISPSDQGGLKPFEVVRCAIEPAEHAVIYQHLQESIIKLYAKPLAQVLRYVIIRGNYHEQTLIFNVDEMTPDVLHAANTLSKTLTKRFPTIVGLFVYEDDSNPQYYLGTTNLRRELQFKKLYGKSEIFQRVLGRSFLYAPLSFSQINQSLIENMIRSSVELLQPKKRSRLYDLYCGYGLFALCLSEHVSSVVGVESSSSSIASAIANAKRQRTANTRFIRCAIDKACIERVMKDSRPEDIVLLDPPRSGTAAGVLESIAARRPARVLHIFCEIDLIGRELQRWQASGYTPVRAIPLDMFPGTATIETMVLLHQE
jgi:tRNA/tmRNA/rRNA uracil-C5-methylase (TrmA/RlmC/RlmD family)